MVPGAVGEPVGPEGVVDPCVVGTRWTTSGKPTVFGLEEPPHPATATIRAAPNSAAVVVPIPRFRMGVPS